MSALSHTEKDPRASGRPAMADRQRRSPALRDLDARLLGLKRSRQWSDSDLAGFRLMSAPFVTIGGGIASFALVDLLRIAQVAAKDIKVVTVNAEPTCELRRLAQISQLSSMDRLRSDSASRVDNVWGFPGYAIREARHERELSSLWKVAVEPVLSEAFTPRAIDVYSTASQEARRIGWSAMTAPGWAEIVRPRRDGGYFTLAADLNGSYFVIRSRHVHLGLGHSGPTLSSELLQIRASVANHNPPPIVSIYEPHEYVYRELGRRGGTAVVRGSGIAAARAIERLLEEKDATGSDITVIHVARHAGDAERRLFRGGADGWRYQTFSMPKGAFGGQISEQLARCSEYDRLEALAGAPGATTPARRRWRARLRRAQDSGAYCTIVGLVKAVELINAEQKKLCLMIGSDSQASRQIVADYMIDCIGLDSEAETYPLISDLVDHGLAEINTLRRLRVSSDFEVEPARSGLGRIYATGAATLGAHLGPVDSFWGLTHASLSICDSLARQHFCERLGIRMSIGGWWKWLRGAGP